jgi:hypothetical protein
MLPETALRAMAALALALVLERALVQKRGVPTVGLGVEIWIAACRHSSDRSIRL